MHGFVHVRYPVAQVGVRCDWLGGQLHFKPDHYCAKWEPKEAKLQAWETFTADDGHPALRARTGADLTAIRVPALCPESGSHDNHGPHPSLGCDLCPTVGRMLAEWQPLTALADAVSAALNAMDEGYANRQHGLTVMDRVLRDIRDAMDAARMALRGDK